MLSLLGGQLAHIGLGSIYLILTLYAGGVHYKLLVSLGKVRHAPLCPLLWWCDWNPLLRWFLPCSHEHVVQLVNE